MRMWLIDPTVMCVKHLLGEHVELHMLCGSLLRKKSIKGFVEKGLLDPSKIHSRHAELVTEMTRRGMAHKSPLPDLAGVELRAEKTLSASASKAELARRCDVCRRMQSESAT